MNCDLFSQNTRMSADDVKMDTEVEATASTSESAKYEISKQPICLIVLGMAGSGKTQFVKKLTQFGHIDNLKPYVVNLDPACKEVPYHANIGKEKLIRFFLLLLCSVTKPQSFCVFRYQRYSKLQRGNEAIPTRAEWWHCYSFKFILHEIRSSHGVDKESRRRAQILYFGHTGYDKLLE